MKASQLKKVLLAAIEAKTPILIKGAPGTGKTDIVHSACNEAEADMVLVFAAMSDPTDGKGLPGMKDGQAEFLPFGFLRKLIEAKKPTVCFMDDLGQAPASVQASFMQLILARTDGNGNKISDHVTFIAATNRREDRAGVTGLLEPVKSRFVSIVELTPDPDEWIEWALQAGLPIQIVAYIKMRPDMLHNFKPSQDLTNSPCPRTIHNVAKIQAMELPEELEFEMFTGAAGSEFAAEYMAFLKIYRSLPNLDSIIMDPEGTEVPKEPSVRFAVSRALARKANENTLARILKYLARMQKEFEVLFIRDAIKFNPEIQQTKAYIKWCSDNRNVLV